MQRKSLLINAAKCTGCGICEMVCAIGKEGVVNPSRSRIHVVRWEGQAIAVPVVCQQCEAAPCLVVCPMSARRRDEGLGRVTIDYGTCIGCKMCLEACPSGGVSFDPITAKVISCDLCDGDPRCVKFCETKAIEYVEASAFGSRRARESARKVLEVVQGSAE